MLAPIGLSGMMNFFARSSVYHAPWFQYHISQIPNRLKIFITGTSIFKLIVWQLFHQWPENSNFIAI